MQKYPLHGFYFDKISVKNIVHLSINLVYSTRNVIFRNKTKVDNRALEEFENELRETIENRIEIL